MTRKAFVWRNVWAGGVGGAVSWLVFLLTVFKFGEFSIGSLFRLLIQPGMLIAEFVCVLLGLLWGWLSGQLLGAVFKSNFGGYSSRNCWLSMGITVVLSALANYLSFLVIANLLFGGGYNI